MLDDEKKRLSDRLRRIEGQVAGVRKMIESDRCCLDVLNQSAAVISAIRTLEDLLVHNHLDAYVLRTGRNVDQGVQKQKVMEIMGLLARVRRRS